MSSSHLDELNLIRSCHLELVTSILSLQSCYLNELKLLVHCHLEDSKPLMGRGLKPILVVGGAVVPAPETPKAWFCVLQSDLKGLRKATRTLIVPLLPNPDPIREVWIRGELIRLHPFGL